MKIEFEFQVMPPMDRPAHRWDICCDAWMRNSWPMQWAFLKMGDWMGIKLFFRFLPKAALPLVTGKCPWHGLKTGNAP